MSMAQAAAPAPLPPWLGDPRRTVIQVEVFVVGAAVLLFVQLILGFCRRQSSNKFIQGGVWVAYTLTFPLVTYTLGMMQSSPIKSQMYPVWAISLFLVSGCTNSITAYDLDDNKQWKRRLFEMLQYYFYVGMIFRLIFPAHLTPLSIVADAFKIMSTPSIVLIVMIFFTNLLRVIACWIVNCSDPSKVVADYMRDQADSRDAQVQGYNPIRMEGYKYIVQWHGYTLISHGAKLPNYRNKLVGDIVTIDMIWEKCNDRLFDSNGNSQLKDVCLSFALFHLLKRRFFGMTCYEAVLPETRDFVFKGLLSEDDDDYARAFRIIEVELGFLHDFFFTKYASIYEMEILFFVSFFLKIIFTVTLGVFVYRNSLILETLSPFIKVDTKTVDIIITLGILGALLIADILQAMLYMASDWALVSLACNYVRNGSWYKIKYSLLRKAVWIFRRGNLFKYWQNKIGQYSVIEGCRWHVSPPQDLQAVLLPRDLQAFFPFFIIRKIRMLLDKTIQKIFTCQYCRSIVHFVRLPDTVKREIASSLMSSSNGYLTNGEASLQRNAVLRRVSLTWNKEDWNQTETMLIWHIATNYCEIALPQVAEVGRNSDQEVRHYREVATKLSRYAAYLMAFVPELLPDNSADTKFTFDKVMEEATEALYPAIHGRAWNGPMVDRDKLLEVIDGSRSDQGNDTIFVKGLKLGRELECIQNSVFRWKVMAEFWSETILYVAPSNNVRGHVEQLANGGEFLTHVWALLSHAGILTRRKKQESQDIV